MKKQLNHRDSRISEDSRYTYRDIHVIVRGLPTYGENSSLIYQWTLNHNDREEKGTARHYSIGRALIDDERTRQHIAASVMRVCCREYLKIERPSESPRMHIPLARA
jgi:hypothetical protein